MVDSRRPFAWEGSYPDGVRWDTPLETGAIPQVLERAVSEFGGKPAIDYAGHEITYDELGRAADRFAAALIERGIGRGAAVGLYLPNSPYHPVSFFGALKAGARITHLSPLDPERVIAAKIADCGIRTLVTIDEPKLLATALAMRERGLIDCLVVADAAAVDPNTAPDPPADPRWIGFSDLLAGAQLPVCWPHVDATDIALIQYTGGTTGLPKGAVLTHANLTASLAAYIHWYEGQGWSIRGQERAICVLPLFHIYAIVTVLLRQVSTGGTVLLRRRFDLETILDDIETGRATAFAGVPTMWSEIANAPQIEKRDFSSLRFCGSSAAPLAMEMRHKIEKLTGVTMRGGWGMTETAPAGTSMPRHAPSKPGSVGLPMPGVEIQIVSLEDPAVVLGVDQVGELRVRGPNVTSGYWNRPEETREAFVDGFFLTGDIGYMDEDGYFFLIDRKKDMIICGGFNVYPQVIEQAIYEHPSVAEVLVVGFPDAHRGETAKAFVALHADAPDFSIDELRAFLADKLGRHELPTLLEIRPALPRTAVGKLSKAELRTR